MVTKSKGASAKKKGNVKVGKLKLKRETVKNLTTDEKMKVKGGVAYNIKLATNTAGCTAPSCACR